MLAGDTPEELLVDIANAQAADPVLGIQGVHFFALASLEKSARFAEEFGRAGAPV
jgi:methylenetetrahydrofolate reductase (NADPH)